MKLRRFFRPINLLLLLAPLAAFLLWSGPKPAEVLAGPNDKLDTPTITCVASTQHTLFIDVCAGATGAKAGFSLHWVKRSDYPNLTCGATQPDLWPATDGTAIPPVCSASFSGNAAGGCYDLGPNECVTLEIGNLPDGICGASLHDCAFDELECGQEYLFRVFAHPEGGKDGLKVSDKSKNYCCSTAQCIEGCTLTQGYWKTHPCNWPAPFTPGANGTNLLDGCAKNTAKNPNQQCGCDDLNTIKIGNLSYSQCDLMCALNEGGSGNALLILAHQLIAAKLNVLNGATAPTCFIENGDIDIVADDLIGNLDILNDTVDPFSPLGQAMTYLANCLDLYNNGFGGIPHCP